MKILCVDRMPWSLKLMLKTLREVAPEAEIHSCREPRDAIAIARAEGCDVLMTEMEFGRRLTEGVDLAREIKKINPRVNIIFVTGCSEWECPKALIQIRISGFISKPYESSNFEEEFANLRYDVS